MTDAPFHYTAVLKPDMSGEATSVIAHQPLPGQPLRAVLWSWLHKAWVSAPGTAAALLYDDQKFDQLRNIDRTTAERISREALHVDLPSEGQLNAIADEGERMGWPYGPPRS
ncbi:hypothetical protein Ade02nite_76140 [Paractinoplanes deccanensis]|uniref:Uncharacterized protein n=1 Tax=Paractinoplanes deccanensis TaxID=113561 RepID=A0ABQ3YG63_9ACTN|nr:hypothetical protein [Actinoplanes deccanensis]GID78973.1 hypothetical protein Ade02nite_76140 [Actinoplanes deccanensis]